MSLPVMLQGSAKDLIDQIKERYTSKEYTPATFVGTREAWDEKSSAEKSKYKLVILDSDDGEVETVVVDNANFRSYINSDYKHYHQSAYNTTTVKISGFRGTSASTFGETFILRQRGGETILFSVGTNSQDITNPSNYSAFRLNKGYNKIASMVFDYTNRDLYVRCAGFGDLTISQIGGETDALTLSVDATIPEDNTYTIPIIDAATQAVESITVTNQGYTDGVPSVMKNGNIVSVSFTSLQFNVDSNENNVFTGLPIPRQGQVYGVAFPTGGSTSFNRFSVISYAGTGVFRMSGATAGTKYHGSLVYLAS